MLGYVLALLLVGGLLFLAASFAFGRGEEMVPVLPDGTPLELPDDRLARGDDLRALRLSVTVRGYRMDEVDWLLDRLSEQLDIRDREIARLRSVLHVEPVPVPPEPGLLTHPVPTVGDLGSGTPSAADDGSGEPAGATAVARRPRPVRDAEPLDPDQPRLGVGDPTRGLRPDGPAESR